MSATLPVLDAEHPWPGLFPYGEEAQAFFHGRERETTELLRLVRRDTCTLLYGQSGLGKSSLLRAGLFPRLRDEAFLPVYLRLDYRDPQLPLREQVWSLLGAALKAARIDGRPPRADESLWEYFHASDVELWDAANRITTPVLVLDQFEEIVQAAEMQAQVPRLDAFLAELADLIENRVPQAVTQRLERDADAVSAIDFQATRFRCVLGFREDFLADLEERFAHRRIATISRLRITKMGETQALSAVAKTGGRLVDEEVAARIVAFVSGAGGKHAARVVEIEPALLSVVCFELNNRRLASGQARISADLLAGAQDAIIAEFYERSVAGIEPQAEAFIERELLTESGYRDSCAVEDAVQRHGVPLRVIQTLVERRILRLEERFGVLRVELTHDVLAPVVRANRDRRQAEAERAANAARERERQRRTRRLLWAGGAVGGVALALMFVFFLMFRQAEAEKARVIEAQSTLFLSRANASLENNVPGEPWRFLARALELNPGNEGALARLVSLAAQRDFARQLWSFPLPTPGEGVGEVVPLAADGFAFLSTRQELFIANIRVTEGGPTLDAACPQRAVPQDAAVAPLARAALPQPSPAPPAGLARIALKDRDWTTQALAAPDARAMFDACRIPRRVSEIETVPPKKPLPPLLRPMALEPQGTHMWVPAAHAPGQSLARTVWRLPLAGGARATLSLPPESGLPRQIWAAKDGRIVAVRSSNDATLHAQQAAGGWRMLTRFPSIGGQPGGHEVSLTAADFSETGDYALLTFSDGTCQMWDAARGSQRWARACAAGGGHRFVTGKPWVALLGTGATVAVAPRAAAQIGSELVLLDVAGGQILGRLQKSLAINHLGLADNGERIVVSAQDRSATVHELPSLAPAGPALLHEGSVVEAHFVPGSSLLVTASFDGSARVWDWRRGVLRVEPLLHSGPVLFARPVLSGSHVLTVGDDRVLRLWRVRPGAVQAAAAPATLLHQPSLSSDGKRVVWIDNGASWQPAAAGQPRVLRPGKAATAYRRILIADWRETPEAAGPLANIRELAKFDEPVARVMYASDGASVLVAGESAWLARVALDGGATQRIGLPAPVQRMQYVPATALVAAQLADSTLRVFDLGTQRQSGISFRAEAGLLDFALSADGQYLTVVTRTQAQVLDARTGYWLRRLDHGGALAGAVHPLRPEVALSNRAGLLRWRPDLRRHATSGTAPGGSAEAAAVSDAKAMAKSDGNASRMSGDARWHRAMREGDATLIDAGKLLVGLRYAPDGSVLGTFSVDGVATTWATDTLVAGPSIRHSNSLGNLDFSSDSRWMVTLSLDGHARVWDHRTGQLMTDALRLQDGETEFKVMGRGSWAVLSGAAGALPGSVEPYFLGLGFSGRPPAWVVATASALAGEPGAAQALGPATKLESATTDESWWLTWLDYVAGRNGVNRQ